MPFPVGWPLVNVVHLGYRDHVCVSLPSHWLRLRLT